MNWKDRFLKKLFSENSDGLDVKGAFELKNKHIPKNIYKYRKLSEYSLDEVKSSKVWLSNPENLNDPYECSHIVKADEIIKEITDDKIKSSLFDYATILNIEEKKLKELIDKENSIEEIFEFLLEKEDDYKKEYYKKVFRGLFQNRIKEIKKNLNKLIKDSFRVSCFSEINDSILMWSHYAEEHRGICIEYNTSKKSIDDLKGRFLFPVIYTDRIIDLSSMYSNTDKINILRFNLVSIYKFDKWSYEKEWRLVIPNGRMKEEGLLKFFPISKVFLGSKISDENQKKVIEVCKEDEIPVMKMTIDSNNYKVLPSG